jgi:hypothetical protein
MNTYFTPKHVPAGPNRNPQQGKPSGGAAFATWIARFVLIGMAGLACWGLMMLAMKVVDFGNSWFGPSGQDQPAAIAPSRPADTERIITLCEKFSDRVAMHGRLPERSPLGWGLLGHSQESNGVAMDRLVETLAVEIGATKVLGSIRTLREVEQAIGACDTMATSTDPAVVAQAVAERDKLKAQARQLQLFIRQELNKEGYAFSEEQIASLCASPNAEDLASMITAFAVIKQITAKMEHRLRIAPSQESAQRYYGGYTVMLLALDNIQKKGMTNIDTVYIPKALDIKRGAEETSEDAARMLSAGGLNAWERRALLMNVDSCQTTIAMADSTERKLQRNFDILMTANNRLSLTIKTARNSHMTALLQKEMIRLEARQTEEIARIEALVVPELVGVSFADPTRPEVTLPRKPRG